MPITCSLRTKAIRTPGTELEPKLLLRDLDATPVSMIQKTCPSVQFNVMPIRFRHFGSGCGGRRQRGVSSGQRTTAPSSGHEVPCGTSYSFALSLIADCRSWPIRFTTAPSTSPAAGVFVCTAKKNNLSTVFAGQAIGLKEVEEGIWLVSFTEYGLGYIDLEEKTLKPPR